MISSNRVDSFPCYETIPWSLYKFYKAFRQVQGHSLHVDDKWWDQKERFSHRGMIQGLASIKLQLNLLEFLFLLVLIARRFPYSLTFANSRLRIRVVSSTVSWDVLELIPMRGFCSHPASRLSPKALPRPRWQRGRPGISTGPAQSRYQFQNNRSMAGEDRASPEISNHSIKDKKARKKQKNILWLHIQITTLWYSYSVSYVQVTLATFFKTSSQLYKHIGASRFMGKR